MSEPENSVRLALLADPGVASLVGTRIYPQHAPEQKTFPYVTYQRISSRRWNTLSANSGVAIVRIQFDCWSAVYAQASGVRAAIASWIDSFSRGLIGGSSGSSGSSGGGGICGLDLRVEDERDRYDDPAHGDEIGEHCCSIDLVITYRQ